MQMDRDHVSQPCKLVTGLMQRPQNNLCMTIPSSAPSSNPNSGCVSPDTDAAPSFPPPQAQVQPQIAVQQQQQQLTGAQEAERKLLKRSLSHCTSLPANVRVTTTAAPSGGAAVPSPAVHVKRLCAVGRPDVKHEGGGGGLVLITATPVVQNSASNSPPHTKEESKHSISSDGLYMLAEQAERRVARDSVSGSNSRRASPECEGVRIRAASMSASDFKYRERFFSPSFKVRLELSQRH